LKNESENKKQYEKLKVSLKKGTFAIIEEWIVICPEKNFFWPYRNIFVMFCAIFSSMLYGFCAVFRTDVDYSEYLEYLNDLSQDY